LRCPIFNEKHLEGSLFQEKIAKLNENHWQHFNYSSKQTPNVSSQKAVDLRGLILSFTGHSIVYVDTILMLFQSEAFRV